MSINFQVGQRVVCKRDGRYNYAREKLTPLQVGAVYRIRSVEFDGCLVRLDEIRASGDQDDLFWHDRFELVAETKTDISIFTKILDEVNAGKVREAV